MDLQKTISTISLVLFWAVWVYGLISIGIVSQYKEALSAAYMVVVDGNRPEIRTRK